MIAYFCKILCSINYALLKLICILSRKYTRVPSNIVCLRNISKNTLHKEMMMMMMMMMIVYFCKILCSINYTLLKLICILSRKYIREA